MVNVSVVGGFNKTPRQKSKWLNHKLINEAADLWINLIKDQPTDLTTDN